MIPAVAATDGRTLNSWKEIASYLQRGVRTVQRWEQELKMPVHRIGHGKRSPVYASVSELKFWLATSGVEQATDKVPRQVVKRGSESTIAYSRELSSRVHSLAREVAESSVRQRRQAELLTQRILEFRKRMG
ncbi:MAG TPA: hypothetical protein VFB28_04335 [Terriglobales bacterium]|nr:hypothetical protein [Terriglobales bacterium]